MNEVHAMHSILTWLAATPPAEFVHASTWAFAVLEMLHFIGLSLLIGVVLVVDLRLLGFAKRLPLGPLHAMLPWAFAGFALNVFSGALFFVSDPFHYAKMAAFWWKMLLVALACANVLLFKLTCFKHVESWGAGVDCSPLSKAIAAASALLWLGVLCLGRLLPYI
jgi:hypothetical protein